MTEYHRYAMTVALAIDSIDSHEASTHALAAAVSVLLQDMGYTDRVDVLAASFEIARILGDSFRTSYWRDNTAGNKMKNIMGLCSGAENLIKQGNINENIRSQTAEAVAEQNRSERNPAQGQ